MRRNLQTRLAALDSRLHLDDGPEEIVVLVGEEQTRADNAALPPVVTRTDALGILSMTHVLAPELRGQYGVSPLKRIHALWGRVVKLGGPSPDEQPPPVGTLDEALAKLRDDGYLVDVSGNSSM